MQRLLRYCYYSLIWSSPPWSTIVHSKHVRITNPLIILEHFASFSIFLNIVAINTLIVSYAESFLSILLLTSIGMQRYVQERELSPPYSNFIVQDVH